MIEVLLMKKILCVVTSNNVKGATGIPTGFWLSELTHPLEKFAATGISYDIASIKGGNPPIDGDSLDFNDAVNKKFWDDVDFQAKLADSAAIQKITRKIYERGGIVSAVCHGPAALVNVKLSDEKYLVDGKTLTSFTNGEEAAVQATDIVPFLLETELKAHGANHIAAANWSDHVEVDGRLVTGQNPASAASVGNAVVKFLS